MSIEGLHPGQLWGHDRVRVMIVAVTPTTVVFEELSGSRGRTRVGRDEFMACYRRLLVRR